MRHALITIAWLFFGVFVTAMFSLIVCVAAAAPTQYMIASFLAMILSGIVTLRCESTIRDLTPVPYEKKRFVAGQDEADEYTEQDQASRNQGTYSISDTDFDGE